MTRVLAALVLACTAACATVPDAADPSSDAPEAPTHQGAPFNEAASYSEALQVWRSPEDINAWIGARFSYDMSRAMLLSETQRDRSGPLPIPAAHVFYAEPKGVCVDLSRFAVETLRRIDPDLHPSYLMIEFAPTTIAGNTLRMHWLASFRRGGKHYYFADSKRPGHLAGPYAGVQDFIHEYATYRGRQVVAFRELDSYQRKQRTLVSKETRE